MSGLLSKNMIEFNAKQIALWIEGTVEGDPTTKVSTIDKIEDAGPSALAFLANLKYEPYLYTTQAAIVLVSKDLKLREEVSATLIRVEDPYRAFAGILQQYEQVVRPIYTPGIHPTAIIDPSVEVPENVHIGAYVVIEKDVKIGEKAIILPQVTIGQGVQIGERTQLNTGVHIYDGCILGQDVVIHSGTVIGSDGFGFVPNEDGTFLKVAQLGGVKIGDFVEIGANCTIDRATMGFTEIGPHCKIDNLVQIAHNVTIGKGTVIAAQTGISGSTHIGDHCMIGGQVGIVGHIHIADRTKINAQSGVAKSVVKEGTALNGTPASDYRSVLKSQVIFKKLPELWDEVNELKIKIENQKDL